MEEKQDEQKPAPKTAKKSNLATILIIIGAVLTVFIISGILVGRYVINKTKDKLTEIILSSPSPSKSVSATSPTPKKTEDNSGRGGGGGLPGSPSPSSSASSSQIATWPTDAPSDLPAYSGGKIERSGKTENPDSWSIFIVNTNLTEFDAYKNLLLSNGWTIKNPNNFRANDYLLSKTGWDLTITYSTPNKTALISLMEDVSR